MSNIIFTKEPALSLSSQLSNYLEDKIFVLCDENTEQKCLPLIKQALPKAFKLLIIKSGEEQKNLQTAQLIWNFLIKEKADRSSVLVNLGGGVITDMGGFAASTFKRGIDFINIPTTLLAQTDASAGGKTGINFGGFKNEVGLFSQAKAVVLSTVFLRTLKEDEFLSGFAEMIKHALIFSSVHFDELMSFYKTQRNNLQNNEFISALVEKSVKIKEHFVKDDVNEKGKRKSLNFGHTFGHAFESHLMMTGHPIKHGFAVAYGMICELNLSVSKCGLSAEEVKSVSKELSEIYGKLDFSVSEIEEFMKLMKHDKKNTANQINCTLIKKIGEPQIDVYLNDSDVKSTLINYMK